MKPVPRPSFRIERRHRKYLSAALAFAIAVVAIVMPLAMLQSYLQGRDEIEQLRTEIDKLTNRTATLAAKSSTDRQIKDGEATIVIPNAEAAATHLQTTLRGLAALIGTQDIRIDSVRVLPTQPDGPVSAVRASASLTAPASHVFDVVNALEAATPPVMIDAIRIVARANPIGLRGPKLTNLETQRAEVALTLRVYSQPPAAPAKGTSGGVSSERAQ